MTQCAETNWKRIANEDLPINTLFELFSWKKAFVWKDVKETFFNLFYFFCGIVTLICELRHTFFINLRFRQILFLRLLVLFFKNLRSAASKFAYSAVCGKTYAPPSSIDLNKQFLKSHILLLNKKYRNIAFYMRHSYNWKGKECLFSNKLYITVPSLMVISKFKNVTWSPWCLTLSSSSFGYISQIDLPSSPPSFIAQRSSIKHFVEWKCLAFILSEEVSDGMYSSS